MAATVVDLVVGVVGGVGTHTYLISGCLPFTCLR